MDEKELKKALPFGTSKGMKKPMIMMLKGLPASGKTTYAETLVDDGWLRVNKDDLRAMLNNGKWSKSNEGFVLSLRDEIIIRGLVSGKNVVVDDTNLNPKHAIQLRSIAEDFDADFEEKFFDVPLEVCVSRNEVRYDSVPTKVILNMYERYVKPLEIQKQLEAENQIDDREEAIIVDVDGTLAHITDGRSPYDASRAMNDKLDDAVGIITAMAYQNDYKVIIVTGRSADHKQVTVDWLSENGIEYDEIYTRESEDNRKDSIVKREIYENFIEPKYNIKFVLDDRNQVVDMWRRIGLKCLQVEPGDF